MATNDRTYAPFKVKCTAGYSSVSERPADYSGEAGEGKYTVTAIIPKDSPEAKLLKAAASTCAKEAFNKKASDVSYLALKDGDKEKPDRAEYANSYFISMKSANQPIPSFEIVNGKPVPTTDVRSGYVLVVKGKFASNTHKGKEQVLAWPDAVLVLEKTETGVTKDAAASMFGDELADYENKAVESLDADELPDDSPAESLDDDWEEPEAPPEPAAKKKKKAAKVEEKIPVSANGASANPQPGALNDGEDWDTL